MTDKEILAIRDLTREAIDVVFSQKSVAFKDPAKAKAICEMRLGGMKYKDIAEEFHLSLARAREYVERTMRIYRTILRKKKVTEETEKVTEETEAIAEMARVIETTEQIARDAHCGLPSPRMYAKDLYWKGYRRQSKGEWKWISDDDCICSACGKVFYTADNADAGTPLWNFCPNCGAKMKGE